MAKWHAQCQKYSKQVRERHQKKQNGDSDEDGSDSEGAVPLKLFIAFDDIKQSLNGYARVVHYQYDAYKVGAHEVKSLVKSGQRTTEYHQLLSVTEGTFRGGLINGFARQLDAAGGCKYGFWKPIDLIILTKDGASVGTSAAEEYLKDATYSTK